MSHPAGGAWIEILLAKSRKSKRRSHPAGGAWIEIGRHRYFDRSRWSHPAGGAWIEIAVEAINISVGEVAPRRGCVDRNYFCFNESPAGVPAHPAGCEGREF